MGSRRNRGTFVWWRTRRECAGCDATAPGVTSGRGRRIGKSLKRLQSFWKLHPVPIGHARLQRRLTLARVGAGLGLALGLQRPSSHKGCFGQHDRQRVSRTTNAHRDVVGPARTCAGTGEE